MKKPEKSHSTELTFVKGPTYHTYGNLQLCRTTVIWQLIAVSYNRHMGTYRTALSYSRHMATYRTAVSYSRHMATYRTAVIRQP